MRITLTQIFCINKIIMLISGSTVYVYVHTHTHTHTHLLVLSIHHSTQIYLVLTYQHFKQIIGDKLNVFNNPSPV